MLKDVSNSYSRKLQNREKMLEHAYSRSMASSMVKGYVDDFFRRLKVDDRLMVSQRNNVAKFNVEGLLEVMLQDNKTELAPDFKLKLHGFLAQNMRGAQQLYSEQPFPVFQHQELHYQPTAPSNSRINVHQSGFYSSLPNQINQGGYEPPQLQQPSHNSFLTTSSIRASGSRFPLPERQS